MRKCSSTGEFPLCVARVAGSQGTAVLLLHRGSKECAGGGNVLAGIKRRINSAHFIQSSQDFWTVPIKPGEMYIEKGTYKVKTI